MTPEMLKKYLLEDATRCNRRKTAPVPVLARVREDAVWIDLRTVEPEETSIVYAALSRAFH